MGLSSHRGEQGVQDSSQEQTEPSEDEAEVVADGGEHGVCVVAVAAFEEVPSQMSIRLHVADGCLDGGSSPELAIDLSVHIAALAGEEHPQRLWRIVASIAPVDMDALDLASGELPGLPDHLAQRMAVIRVAVDGAGVEHELPVLATPVGGRDRDLAAELPGLVRLALADALGLRRVPGMELPAALLLAPMAAAGADVGSASPCRAACASG